MGHLVVRVLSGSQQVPETRSGSEAQQNSLLGGAAAPGAAEPAWPPAHHRPSTFSLWMSLLIWEILIFMASSSSSSTRGMLGVASDSSTV